jgi:hypothetical protein
MPIGPDGHYADAKVTAKVAVSSRVDSEWGDVKVAQLSFAPDYTDGRNSEWAAATPALHLAMTVRRDIADTHFPLGKKVTLTFEKSQD